MWSGKKDSEISNSSYALGVPSVAQRKQIYLVTMRFQVWPLASLIGLRIWHCPELWCRSQMQLGSCVAVVQASSCNSNLTSSLGTPICLGVALKKQTNKQKKKQKKKELFIRCRKQQKKGTLIQIKRKIADQLVNHIFPLIYPRN